MSRLAAIFVALFAVTAVPAAEPAFAASAEGAVKAWIAAVPAGGWALAYRDIAYDQASDKTTIRNLAATSTRLNTTIAFPTIAVTGYTQTPDGGFNATLLAADLGTISIGPLKYTINGVEARNFGIGAMPAFTFDPAKPFESVVKLYSYLLNVHLDRGQVAQLTFEDPATDSEYTYSDLVISNWANGKIASMTTGPMDYNFTDKSGLKMNMQIGSAETSGTDLDAFVRVFDPSRYVNGVGDGVWRTAMASAVYHDFSIDAGPVYVSMGSWVMEDLKMRQPKQSFTAVIDQASTLSRSGGKSDDLPPEAARGLLNMLSSMSLGKFGFTDISVDTPEGFGTLEGFTIKDISSDGIGEISIDYLDAFYTDGFVTVARAAMGGMVFPSMDKIIAAVDASAKTGKAPDFSGLTTELGFIDIADLSFETNDTPKIALDKFRLDLKNYVGLVPTAIGLDVVGFDTSVDLFDNDGLDQMLRDLGYTRVHADYRVKLAWREADSTVSLDDFRLAVTDVGILSGSSVLGGLTRKDLSDVNSLRDALMDLNLVSSSLTLEDKSIINRWIAQQAFDLGVDQTVVRTMLANQAAAMASGIGSKVFQAKLADAVKTYILRPGKLTVTAKPPDPLPVSGIALFGAIFPETLPEILGLDISVVAGPEPVPFRYNPPAKDDGSRHSPLKKY